MVDWKIIKDIERQFVQFQNHTGFFIRERLYKGSGKLGVGLSPSHMRMIGLVDRTAQNPVPDIYLQMKNDDFVLHVEKLHKTLELLMFMSQKEDKSSEELKRTISIIDMEINELEDFLSSGHTFDPGSIQSEKELGNLRVDDLALKIEDNFNQISLSSEWRRLNSMESSDVKIYLDQLSSLLNTAKSIAYTINSEDYLNILSIIAISIRDIAAKNLPKLKEAILFFITVSKILQEDLIFEFNGDTITPKDVKDDIELKINLKNVNWLIKVHNSIITDYPDAKHKEKFAILLYKLSRNKREDFKWTLSTIAAEQKNNELAYVSVAYSNLVSILVKVNQNLNELSSIDVHNAITQVTQVVPSDLIEFSEELYSSEQNMVTELIQVIKNQIGELKSLIYQIIQMEDIREIFNMVVQFSFSDLNLEDGKTFQDYIDLFGDREKFSTWK